MLVKDDASTSIDGLILLFVEITESRMCPRSALQWRWVSENFRHLWDRLLDVTGEDETVIWVFGERPSGGSKHTAHSLIVSRICMP